MFEINGYGQSVRDTDPAMVALNRKYYGVDNIAQLIQKCHPGGIIYFTWSNSLAQPSHVVNLSNGIQRVALAQRTRVPMLISTDQEYGEVLRIGSPATVFPGNMPLGATRNTGYARAAGRIGGEELRAMGINVDNAPVVDVNIDPLNQADGIRAYGDRVPLVSSLGAAQVKGYQTERGSTGVAATAKHWPGFGAAPVNSDTGVAVSPQTLPEVIHTNLPPFQAAMKAGIDRIMVTHILFPKITGKKIPTSLSPFWINGLLRGYLHYNGLVVTDALDAAALNSFGPAEVALRAFRAGVDQLLEVAQTPSDSAPADLVKAYPAVLKAVRTHAISKRRLDESVTRILELKWKLGLVKQPITNPDRVTRVVHTPKHLAAAQTIADHSITLLKNDDHLLPLKVPATTKVLVTGFGQTTTATLAKDLASRGLAAQALPTGSSPTPDDIAKAVQAAEESDLVVVSTFNAWGQTNPQVELVNALLALGKPVVVAAVGTPYDVAYLPNAPTFIASYGYQPVSVNALVKVMFGELQPTGRLPVTITEPPPSTKALYRFG
ncbi:MAG: glycoside hydrolase family 3 C-terminal domain-containing protein [Solirubrobacterales bacterium]|nr:glycoside hydrolase family 3 C-terminal domain-containing protein [Solirubrobacterales bacterium]